MVQTVESDSEIPAEQGEPAQQDLILAARAVAGMDDLKCELRFEMKEDQGNYAASLRQDVIDPLRVEMVQALAVRDVQIEALRQEVAANQLVSVGDQVKMVELSRNIKDVADLQAKVKVLDRRQSDAISRLGSVLAVWGE